MLTKRDAHAESDTIREQLVNVNLERQRFAHSEQYWHADWHDADVIDDNPNAASDPIGPDRGHDVIAHANSVLERDLEQHTERRSESGRDANKLAESVEQRDGRCVPHIEQLAERCHDA